MTTLLSTIALLISLTAGTGGPRDDVRGLPSQAAAVPGSRPSDAALSSLLRSIELASGGTSPWERALQNVFVVPGPDLSAESLAQIGEDMAVMCRILDKAFLPMPAANAAMRFDPYGAGPYGGQTGNGRSQTEGLYLDGYGTIFFIGMDLPLSPPQERTEETPEPTGDPLWSETMNELRGGPQERSEARRPQYDAQKVEDLKTTLIGSLRHAANLRVLGQQDTISIVVIGRTGQNDRMQQLQNMYGDDYMQQMMGVRPTEPASKSSTMLILRTTKGNVDAFAKEDLTQEQFAEKVQVLRSWAAVGPEASSAGGGKPKLLMPSQNRRY